MKIKVRLFAELRERAGVEWLELEVKDRCRVREVIRQLSELLPETFKDLVRQGGLAQGYTIAIGTRHASLDEEVPANSVVAILPPVGGGL
ncbi:MAG: MoaD/ThiS family protein [Candidatus Nezhaarchaeota archaeon]|nr:MoaD/ThiS family protein [Candidatus Nezhaarchaeota archaeon]